MRVQHLLLSRDGKNQIIERDNMESQLEISSSLQPDTSGHDGGSAGRRVAVNKHYYKGKYYAVAAERHAASNEIDDLIALVHLEPIE
ncbi:hypothetical protein [Pantoea sp.]|uniref:hypothetical protein n=1 Tax=Pantoea sp. TaxID=69393 RepID=UPI002897DBD0|nr:hypothetical protein [Pantoea sp.]